jgi:putative transcriptional regulator
MKKEYPAPAQVKEARAQTGLTQTDAGRTIHAALRTWQEWEAGDSKMHPGLFELFLLKTGQID